MLGIILLIVLPFYYILKKWIIPQKPLKVKIGITCIFFLVITFLCGYKIPWFDKFPNIKGLPDHTNKKEIRIELIKTLDEFTHQDSLIFPMDSSVSRCNACPIDNIHYKKNLRNITFYTSSVKKNKFEFNNPFVNGLTGMGSSGGSGGSNSGNWDFHFYQNTRDYNKLKIGSKETVFKGDSYMGAFYQFNYPKSERDTLYFAYFNALYKAYVIK